MTIASNYPTINPSLDLDFANSTVLDPRISFTRAGTGTYYDGQTSALAEQNLIVNPYTTNIGSAGKTAGVNTTTGVTDYFDGTTAVTYTENTSGSSTFGWVPSNPLNTLPTIGTITFSCYVKYVNQQYVSLCTMTSSANTVYATFDILNGINGTPSGNPAASNLSCNLVNLGGGWFRLSVTGTATTGANILGFSIVMAGSTPTFGFQSATPTATTGDSVSAFTMCAPQFEYRSFAGLYTPTTTAAITNYIPQLLTAPVNQPRFDFNPTTRQSLGLLMEQQSTNLLTYSSDYTNAVWTATNATVTASANISPDGTLDAQLLTDNSTNGLHNITQTKTLTATPYTFSIYAKAGSITYMKMSLATSGTNGVIFNLSTGAYVSNDAGFTYTTPQSVGNGWYRYSITFTGTAASYIAQVLLCSNSTTFSYAGTGQNAYFFGAQLEATAFPTSYIPTQASQVTRAQDFATMSGTNFSSWFNNQQGTVYCSFDSATLGAPAMSYWAIDNNSSAGYYANRATGSATLTVFQGSASASAGTISAVNTVQQNAYSYNNTSGSLAASGLLNGGSIGTITSVQLSFLPTQLSLGKYVSNTNPMTGHIRKFAYYPIATTSAQMQALTGS